MLTNDKVKEGTYQTGLKPPPNRLLGFGSEY